MPECQPPLLTPTGLHRDPGHLAPGSPGPSEAALLCLVQPSAHSWKTGLSFPKPGLLLLTLKRVGGCSLEQDSRQAAVTQGHPELSEPAGPTSDANHLLREG